jgi:glutathione S-transferase
LADAHPEKGLIARAGTWERAQHDQWVAFTLAELEANLWSTARNQFIYPEEKRVTQIFEQNAEESKRAAGVLEQHLEGRAWLVGERFSVTDIFVGYALNWARLKGLTTHLPNVEAYCERLLSMPLCPFPRSLTRPQS